MPGTLKMEVIRTDYVCWSNTPLVREREGNTGKATYNRSTDALDKAHII